MSLPGDITITPADEGAFAQTPTTCEASTVLTRACRACGGSRVPGDPVAACPQCGLQEAGQIIDLGVTSASYADPERQAGWDAVGKPAAAARAAAANLTSAAGR